MIFSIARQGFYQEICQPEDQIDLAKASLYIALEAHPNLQVEEYLNALDVIAADVSDRLPSERYPLRVIRAINEYLYDELRFQGNDRNYYDPDNSYLNCVIDRRTGIPISLSLVYLEIAKRLDFPMVGVGLPGHFLIRPNQPDLDMFVDPFNRGEVLFEQDCAILLQRLYGRSTTMQPGFLEPISPRRFLVRMLANLKGTYINRGEMSQVLAVIDRILMLFPDAPTEQRDRGLIYYQVGRWTEARQDLENYLNCLPSARDAVVVQELLKRMESGTK
ncbi:MAG: transglutaminase-like domain-containing protein [Elainellaceae cyanobacterium]